MLSFILTSKYSMYMSACFFALEGSCGAVELLLLSRSAVAILRFMSLYRSHKRAYSSDEKDWLSGEVELVRASVAVGCRSVDVVGALL